MLHSIHRIIQDVHAAKDFNEALQAMVHAIRKTLSVDACSVFLLDHSCNEYVLMATEGLNTGAVGSFRRKATQGIVGQVGEQEKAIKTIRPMSHTHFLRCPELKEEQYNTFLGVPIIHHRRLLGVLTVQQTKSREFAETEEAFLVTISVQMATVIAHADAMGVLANKLNPTSENVSILQGIAGSGGIAIGTVVPVYPLTNLDTVLDRATDNIDDEILSFKTALQKTREEIHHLSTQLEKKLPAEEHALFAAYIRILEEDSLSIAIIHEIEKGQWAQGALRRVIQQYIYQLESVEDDYLRELSMDIRDLGQRILAHLQQDQNILPEYPANTILAGEALTASILAEIPSERLAGLISLSGSANSHVAILARALGIPAVMAADALSLPELAGCKVIVDGYNGEIHLSPSVDIEKEFSQRVEQQQQLDAGLEQLRQLPAKTLDGHLIALAANIGLTTDADRALKAGAESIGLYRTEVPFMTRDRFPGEIEQQIIYQQLLHTFSPYPVTMRTLDIGGDKALPYFPIEEENPFLGWRGIRITLDHPDIFLMQIRAMLRASHNLNNLQIMLPMISDVGEVDEALLLIKRAYEDIHSEKLNINMPLIGVMIEVPSAVYQTRALAKRVDFLSVGSNDLTQYLLAVDRNNPRVAELYNALHPAVLCALKYIICEARAVDTPVSICGEMTSDPAAVIALLGMGFTSLSMNAISLPRIKWVIRNFSLQRAQEILTEILEMDSPKIIRNHLELALEQAGLSELTRLGI